MARLEELLVPVGKQMLHRPGGGRGTETQSCCPGPSLPTVLVPGALPLGLLPALDQPQGPGQRAHKPACSWSAFPPLLLAQASPSPTPTQSSCPRRNKQPIVPLGACTGSLQAGTRSGLFPGSLSSHPAGSNPLPEPGPPPPPQGQEPRGRRPCRPAGLSLPSSFPTEDAHRISWHTRCPPSLTQTCKFHPAASLPGSAWMTSSQATSGPTQGHLPVGHG